MRDGSNSIEPEAMGVLVLVLRGTLRISIEPVDREDDAEFGRFNAVMPKAAGGALPVFILWAAVPPGNVV